MKVTRRGALRIRTNPVAASATLDFDVVLRRRPVVVTAALQIPFREGKKVRPAKAGRRKQCASQASALLAVASGVASGAPASYTWLITVIRAGSRGVEQTNLILLMHHSLVRLG